MLFIILILLFPLEIITNTICSSNETTLVSNYHFQIKNQNNFELIEQFQPFTYINALEYQLQGYNLILATRQQNIEKLLLVYQNNDFLLFRVGLLNFEMMNDTLKNYTFNAEEEISIQSIGTLLNAYFNQEYLYLVYENIQDPIEYIIQIIDHQTKIVVDKKVMRKQKNCIFKIEEFFLNFFYFAQFNCYDWQVSLFEINTFELYQNISNDQFKQILRFIQINQYERALQMIFDNNVYQYTPQTNQLKEIFVSEDRNILFYDYQFHILSTNSKQEQQNISHKTIIRNERPKKIVNLQTDLLILFDSHIELFKNTDLSFSSIIQLDDIFPFKSTYPYIYGVKNNKLILIKSNQMNPFFLCNGNQSYISKFYKDYNPFQFEWIFTMKKMEIKNESIQFFNIHENIFQEIIPILLQEMKQDELEFDISLDKFILGGPFNILGARFNQNNTISYEYMQSSICEFLDFKTVLWWVIFTEQKDQQWIILYQDNNLFLTLVNCDLLIKKKLVKLGKIEKSQIFQKNNFIIIQQNKQLLLSFELQHNLMYRTKQFSFNKDIKQIQLLYEYFLVYLQDWEQFLIYKSDTNQIYRVGQHNTELELETKIVYIKQGTYYQKYIVLESQLILYSHHFQHIFSISDVSDIIEGIEKRSKEFVIIHKTKIQDKIIIALKKYQLHNLQLKFLFELPKPNQSFQYIWPICKKEDNQYLTIAAKEITTNHTYILIYEISQPYSKILKEIIQVDCCECLTLYKFGLIIYQFQHKIYKRSIEFIKFKVQIQQSKQFQIQSTNMSINLQSKINPKILQGIQIQLISFSHTEELIIKKSQNLHFKQFKTIVFDPRQFIFGPLQNIDSSSIIITPALKIINQTILAKQYPNIEIFDYYRVIKTLNTTNFDGIECCEDMQNPKEMQALLEENGSHTFLITILRNYYEIQIFNSNYILVHQFKIQPGYNIESIIQIDKYYFIICKYLILVYQINSNQIELVDQISHQFIEGNIEKVNNKLFHYLAYDKVSTNQQCILIRITETNQISTIIYIIDLDKKLNLLLETFFKIIFKNIEFIDDNYLSLTGFYFKQNLYAQLFKLKIDNNQIASVIHSGIIKYPKNTEIKKFLFLNQFIVILFQSYKINGFKLQLYDLHEIEQFEIFDSIQMLEGNISDIMYHDNSSFILVEQNQNENQGYTITKYQVNQYLFEFITQESEDYYIRINNQLTSIEMIITFEKDLDSNLYIILVILFINLLFILILLNKKKKI